MVAVMLCDTYWVKINTNESYKQLYFCKEGALKGSSISIIKQNNFQKNRNCRITLEGRKKAVNSLTPKISNSCNEVTPYEKFSGITENRYAFYFRNGDDKQSIVFKNCIDLIDRVSELGSKIKGEITSAIN